MALLSQTDAPIELLLRIEEITLRGDVRGRVVLGHGQLRGSLFCNDSQRLRDWRLLHQGEARIILLVIH